MGMLCSLLEYEHDPCGILHPPGRWLDETFLLGAAVSAEAGHESTAGCPIYKTFG
jgi:hypothetical protein